MLLSPKRAMRTVAVLLMVFAVSFVVMAQESPTTLIADAPIQGTLNSENLVDVYAFDAEAGASVTVSVTGDGIELTALLLDAQGNTLGQASGEAVAFENTTLASAGRYVVTVFGGAETDGDYAILLSVAVPETPTDEATGEVATEEPAQTVTTFSPSTDVLLNNGIEVNLAWVGNADLNLEVRDPLGNSLYFDNRSSPIGGLFGFDANGVCQLITETPVETATWQPGFLPSGSYEVLVFYRQSCDTVASNVDFTLTVTVNGVDLEPVIGTITPPSVNQNSVYLSNFVITPQGQATVNTGGAYPDSAINQPPAPVAEMVASANAIQRDSSVTGDIFESQDYLAYTISAQANEVLTVSLSAVAGNLDTLLQLFDPNGNLIAVNDDANSSTNSQIVNQRILQSGNYLIVATRYGKEIGGTEGQFSLTVSETTASLPADLESLNLPQGDIQIYLTWNTGADLQLLVRDPVGQSIYDDNPRVNSGGLLAANGNVGCQVVTTDPVSYIYWPTGLLRPGIYEVEVWFQNTCQDTNVVEFTLTVVVAGQVVAVERELPNIADRFVISFEVQASGAVVAGQGGFISTASSVLDFQSAERLPISFNLPVTGSITFDNPFDVYTFQGTAGQVATINMQAVAGTTLDTNLFLIGPTGVQIATNDDADAALVIGTQSRTTDSLISAFTLPADGEYLIIASRFATIYGGTVGGYQLSLQLNN